MANLRGKNADETANLILTKGDGGKIYDGDNVEYFDPDAKADLSLFNELTVNLSGSGNFIDGSLHFERAGNIVTVRVGAAITHPSMDQADSELGVIPESWRPPHSISSVYLFDERVGIFSDGRVRVAYTSPREGPSTALQASYIAQG